MNEDKQADAPPTVTPAAPEQELEHKLRDDPKDQDAKVDVGSDQSMDASDPSAAAQPGQSDKAVPSSGFPE